MKSKILKNSLLACLVVLLSSCTARPVKLTEQESFIRVYNEVPNCKYENLGIVIASSGNVNWDINGNEEATLSRLRKNAHKLGADAIIIRSSKKGERQSHSSSVLYTMRGNAIKNCSQE
jgi:hypothetical protein